MRRFLKNNKKSFGLEISILICLIIMYINLLMIYLTPTLQLTRLSNHSKNLSSNSFSNFRFCGIISGNLTATISDHPSQFLFAPNILSNSSCNKSNISERDWSKFNKANVILPWQKLVWYIQLDRLNVDLSIESFLNTMNSMLVSNSRFNNEKAWVDQNDHH